MVRSYEPFATKLELAWAAGFFDGEGNVRYTPARRNARYTYSAHMTASIQQRRPEPLLRFHAAMGSRGNVWQHKAGHWRWTASALAAREAMDSLEPFLSLPKLEQLRAVRAVL